MVYYNNVLSLPFFIFLATIKSEIGGVFTYEGWNSTGFLIIWIISGIMGLLISAFSFLCMNVAGPTTYAVVGALNKAP